MALWSGIFTKDARPAESRAATGRALSTIARSSFSAYTLPSDNVTQIVEGHYTRVLWVWRAVDAIAFAECPLPMRVWSDRSDSAKLIDGWEDLEKILNVRPNRYEKAWQFRYRISTLLLLSTMGVFIEIVPDKLTGRPAELHILAPDAVQPLRDAGTYVSGYRVRTVEGFKDLPPERVLWIRGRPHPTDPYKMITPLMAAGISADTNWLAHVFNNNWLRNDGRPGMLISVGNDVGQEDADELKRRFGSYARGGETSVIQSEQVTVNDLGGTPRDAQHTETLSASKQEILEAFGVSETFLAWAEGRTFDNADAEIEVVWQNTMRQHCLMVGSGFDILVEDDDPSTIDATCVAHDLSKIEVLQRAKRNREEQARQEFAAGLITVDEYREITGREPWAVPATKALWMSATLMPVGPDDATTKGANAALEASRPAPPPVVAPVGGGGSSGGSGGGGGASKAKNGPAGAAASPKGTKGPLATARDVAKLRADIRGQTNQAAAIAVRPRSRAIASAKARLPQHAETKDDPEPEVLDAEFAPDAGDALADEHGQLIAKALEQWAADMIGASVGRMEGVKARKGTRHWETEDKAYRPNRGLTETYIVQADRWGHEISTALRAMIRHAASGAMADVRPYIGIEAEGIMRASRLVRNLVNRLADDADRGVAKRIRRIQQMVRRMDDQGASIEEIKDRVYAEQSSLDRWSAMVGPRLALAAVQGARKIMFDRVPDELGVAVWRSMDDHRVRPTHVEADGQVARRGRNFTIGGYSMAHPGDPRAPAKEWANCRCRVAFRTPDGNEL